MANEICPLTATDLPAVVTTGVVEQKESRGAPPASLPAFGDTAGIERLRGRMQMGDWDLAPF